MEAFLNDPTLLMAVFTLAALGLAAVLEALAPRRALTGRRLGRWFNNYTLGAVTWWISTLATAGLVVLLARWTNLRDLGLFQHFAVPGWTAFLTLALVSQFLAWVLHVAFHKAPFLWPLHAIHHLDTDLDASTTFRNHPLEPLVFLPVLAPLILLLGVSPGVALANQFFQVAVNIFSHSNLRLPQSLDRALGWFIVTPDFHRLHHCAERRHTDSNYGQAIPWFDHLFGTSSRRPYEERAQLKIGLEYLRDPEDSRVDRLLLLPFRWRRARRGSESSARR